jgi:hypothetical protein
VSGITLCQEFRAKVHFRWSLQSRHTFDFFLPPVGFVMPSLPFASKLIGHVVSCLFMVFSMTAAATGQSQLPKPDGAIRVATVNGSLYRDQAGQLARELEQGSNPQAIGLASILQTVRPDILLINEIDYEADHRAVVALIEKYLRIGQTGQEGTTLDPLDYQYFYSGPVNTGVDSGLDLNGDGILGGPEDAWGYGRYPGQYGMVLLSRFPILSDQLRTFQNFRWSSLPNAKRPIDPTTGQSYYPDPIWQALRLSSKSHWDVPIEIEGTVLHLLASHPTPPAFDGPEDRNGRRNHDEIRFWTEYIEDGEVARAIVDDVGVSGGLGNDEKFVIVGDLNADPTDGSGIQQGIGDLLAHRRTTDPRPTSRGAQLAAASLGQANATHRGDPALDTSQFSPRTVGNLRVDYAIPSSNLELIASGVFWPTADKQAAKWIEITDHRLVWIDLRL